MMRKTPFFMILLAAAAFHPFLYAEGQQIAKVYQVDKAHKVIVISGQIQDKLSTGDKVYAKTSSGFVELVVTMPMMSVAKCRIPPVNDPSDFAKIETGQEIYVGVKPSVRKVQSVSADSLKGTWKESWQPGRQSDVTYNDIYEIDLSSSVPVRLRGSDGSFVRNAGYQNGVLTFTQHTSFDVTYTLSPDSSGSVLSGKAVSVKGTFSVKWEKVDASYGDETVSLSSPQGSWKEFWAPGQETNVTYHDEYDIAVSGSSVSVKLKNSDGSNISDVVFSGGILSFTQKTAFDVKYSLRLSADGQKLEGTAITPNKTVPIRWERISGAAVSPDAGLDGKWKEFWAPGQETNVTYNDIYLISTSGGLSIRLEKEDSGNISGIEFSGGWLSFTQKTAFDVKYKLKLDKAGRILEGTAVTPYKTVPIRWEKQ